MSTIPLTPQQLNPDSPTPYIYLDLTPPLRGGDGCLFRTRKNLRRKPASPATQIRKPSSPVPPYSYPLTFPPFHLPPSPSAVPSLHLSPFTSVFLFPCYHPRVLNQSFILFICPNHFITLHSTVFTTSNSQLHLSNL